MQIERIVHPFFQANAWILMSDTHAVVVDTAANDSGDAERVIEAVKKTGRTLQAVLLSHGHPDIWLGVKRMREAFPNAKVLVADKAIIDDVVAMGGILDHAGMLAKTPELSPSNYDYRAAIEVLPERRLVIKGSTPITLDLDVTTQPSEFTRLTTFWESTTKTLFVADLAYNGVHSWAGMGVDRSALNNWIDLLSELIAKRGTTDVRVLCGHGPATDMNVLLSQRAYLEMLRRAIDDNADIRARMLDAFPHHAGADFQLAMTVQNRSALT